MADIPNWWMKGDWFDLCSCNLPCPCVFAQAPTGNHCEGVLAYGIREGAFGQVRLDGLKVIALGAFDGNIWAGGDTKMALGIFIDERANEAQRDALQRVFSGQAGGFMALFADLIGELRGVEYVPIEFEVAEDLARWRVSIPGRISGSAEALAGPMTPAGARVQLHHAPGAEVGPGQVATWANVGENQVDAFGFQWNWAGRSSKHFPFDWTGPD